MNSDKDIPLLSSIYKSKHTGRASASTRKKGSITVEAAMAVPIFFFATLALVLLLELLSVQTAVRSGLQEAGKKLAVQAVNALINRNYHGYIIFCFIDFSEHIHKKCFDSVCTQSVRKKYDFFHINTCQLYSSDAASCLLETVARISLLKSP